MRYDFKSVRKAINESGKTLKQVADLTGIHEGTISRALKTGRAHQSTAVRLTNAFRIDMAAIQVDEEQRTQKTA